MRGAGLPALGSTLERLARDLPGATATTTGGTTTWMLGGTPFAIVEDGSVDLRLDAAVATAALKTPETARSERGPEWVRYAPLTLEGHDLDRLVAWFGLAHRRADQSAPRRPT